MAVLNDDSLASAHDWLTIAVNALYTAIDFISQLILVSELKHTLAIVSRLTFFRFFFYEALPMLDHVAPTIGYGFPMPFITCIFRC